MELYLIYSLHHQVLVVGRVTLEPSLGNIREHLWFIFNINFTVGSIPLQLLVPCGGAKE